MIALVVDSQHLFHMWPCLQGDESHGETVHEKKRPMRVNGRDVSKASLDSSHVGRWQAGNRLPFH